LCVDTTVSYMFKTVPSMWSKHNWPDGQFFLELFFAKDSRRFKSCCDVNQVLIVPSCPTTGAGQHVHSRLQTQAVRQFQVPLTVQEPSTVVETILG
jgi:hypothetical protein